MFGHCADRHIRPQCQDIFGQPLHETDFERWAKVGTLAGMCTVVFTVHAPDLDDQNRFFNPMGTLRIKRCSCVETTYVAFDWQQVQGGSEVAPTI